MANAWGEELHAETLHLISKVSFKSNTSCLFCYTYFDLAVTKRLSLPTELRMLSVADFSCKPPMDRYIYFGQLSSSEIVYCLPHSLMLQA
jgi:hypothetical protein